MKDLFGVEAEDFGKPPKKSDHAHPAPPGSGPQDKACRDCASYKRIKGGANTYRKCEKMRRWWTCGPGTDIRAKDPACRLFEQKAATPAAFRGPSQPEEASGVAALLTSREKQ